MSMGYWGGRKSTKKLTEAYGRGEHVMNKLEGKVMRRIRAETGMSEEEVRSHKKYRVMLSDAQIPGKAKELERRSWRQAYEERTKWGFGSNKAMFKQKTMQVLNGDKEATARLYKRYAGGLVDDRRPAKFFYVKFKANQPETQIMQAIDKTDGQFAYSPNLNEVGFAYEASLTVFSLVYEVQ